MRELRLSTVGAVCALVAVAGFVAGVALMATNGVSVLIPGNRNRGHRVGSGRAGRGRLVRRGAWDRRPAGLVGIVALVGFYDVLKHAGPVMIIAPIAGAVGLTLVTASHVIPIAMAQELALSYTPENADVFDTFASACLLLNYFGNVQLGGGHATVRGRDPHDRAAALGGLRRVDRGRLRRLARSVRNRYPA